MLQGEVTDPQFPEYRKREIAEAAEFMRLVWSNTSPDYIRGALDMFASIIKIPEKVAKTPEEKEYISAMLQKDFAKFEMEYIKRSTWGKE